MRAEGSCGIGATPRSNSRAASGSPAAARRALHGRVACVGRAAAATVVVAALAIACARGGASGKPQAPSDRSASDDTAESAGSDTGASSEGRSAAARTLASTGSDAGAVILDGGQPPADAAAAPSTNPDVASGAMDGPTYAVRLRDLQTKVNDLKDEIRRSHTKLALLSQSILGVGAAGAKAEVVFRNEMSSAYRLTRVLFVVDGVVQVNRMDESGGLSDQQEVPIFSGSLPPGDHSVQVVLGLRGNGYGVFTYSKGYKFDVKSSHSFSLSEGKNLSLVAIAMEKGGVTTPLEQRPTVEWLERVNSSAEAPAGRDSAGGRNAPSTPSMSRESRAGEK